MWRRVFKLANDVNDAKGRQRIAAGRAVRVESDSELQMPLDKLAELFAVFVFHVDEFDAVSVRADVADDGGEVNLAKARADFQFDGIADIQFLGEIRGTRRRG